MSGTPGVGRQSEGSAAQFSPTIGLTPGSLTHSFVTVTF
ncbi:Uncharacterised protein [Amycolatopsis camponoti]|uniref:Uncharacterized protein n=1 Tax=Amycolatopsis camponoti TaxID=2606593 RepID=A0A6I8LQ39_9PSEU|nr:Uncharacterised protein [Amycolatopsis camponoti]